jgi:hypothetical protein
MARKGSGKIAMAVNNVRVRQIIDDAIAKVSAGPDPCCGKIYAAWHMLKAWRDEPPLPGQPPNSLDLEVAAAENYMYARASVCSGFVNRLQMNIIAMGYYSTKLAGHKMPTSGNPQSPHDLGVLGWGGIGSQEGAADRDRCNKSADPPYWRPVNEIMGRRAGYVGFVGRPGTRYAPPPATPSP